MFRLRMWACRQRLDWLRSRLRRLLRFLPAALLQTLAGAWPLAPHRLAAPRSSAVQRQARPAPLGLHLLLLGVHALQQARFVRPLTASAARRRPPMMQKMPRSRLHDCRRPMTAMQAARVDPQGRGGPAVPHRSMHCRKADAIWDLCPRRRETLAVGP